METRNYPFVHRDLAPLMPAWVHEFVERWKWLNEDVREFLEQITALGVQPERVGRRPKELAKLA